MALWIVLQTPYAQNKIGKAAARYLGNMLGTKVTVGGMQFGLLNRFQLNEVLVSDRQNDTLLYVGSLKLATLDWFLGKDTIDITYVGLSDTHIKFQRVDSVWNQAFLEAWLSGGSSRNAKRKPIRLNADMVELENVKYEKLDYWKGKKHIAEIGYLNAKCRLTDFENGKVEMDDVKISDWSFREIKTKGGWTEADSIAYWHRIDSLDALPHKNAPENTNPFRLTIKNIDIASGNLQFYNRKKRPSVDGVFDERDITILDIGGKVKDFRLVGDTIKANVRLQANERSGFRIQSLSTDFTMHPQMMEFANLDLVTTRSRLGPYYAMRYRHFDDMEDFLDKVSIEAHLQDAKVSVEDIAVFAPDLKGIVQNGILSGNAFGTVSDFTVNNLDLRTGQSKITGTYAMRGLVDIENTIIDFKTNGSWIDVKDIEPWAEEVKSLRETPVAKLGPIEFKGNFQGTPFDFFVKGTFTTNAGPLDADLKLKVYGANVGYSGNIKSADIIAGPLFGVPKLGRILFSGQVSSNGFGFKNPVLISGKLDEITYDAYTYRDVDVNSEFVNNLLTANLEVTDPNLIGNISTTLNFREARQRYNARGRVNHANFSNLKLFGDTLLFKGDFDIDFEGNKVDDFLGYARFYNASFISSKGKLSFDSLLLESEMISESAKRLSIATNEAIASLEGRFQLSRLGDSFSLFLSRYYPALIKAPEGDVPGQDFSFDIKTREVEPFLQLFDRNLTGGEYANIFGSLNTETNQLLLSADIPSVGYDNLRISSLDLQGNGSLNSLNVFGTAANIQINEKISFPNAELRVATLRDSTRLTLNTTSSGTLGSAAIDADLFSLPRGFALRFNESSFIANKKKWTIERDGGFELRNNYLISEGLVIVQEQQRLELFTRPSSEGNWNDVYLNTYHFNLGDWLPYFVTDPSIEGIANGQTIVEDPMGKPVLSSDLTINQFYFNGDSVGTVSVSGKYDNKADLINAQIKSENPQYDFDALVQLDLNNDATRQIDAVVEVRNERISVLKRYLRDIFSEIDGYANGQLRVLGSFEKPAIIGQLRLTEADFLIDYTQCRYRVDSATIELGDNFIDFGSINVKDVKGRAGRAEGRMYHRFFDSLSFNIRMRTDGMQVLNTSAKDNDLFYGQAVARATFDLNGPLNNLQMRITGVPTDSSWIAVTNEESRTSGEADYIVFKEYGAEVKTIVDTSITNIHILLELTANPLCRVDVVLDELTGDIISATGSGTLVIRSGTVDPTFMRGRYNIESGNYNYTFQSFIRKPFILRGDGNNFIEWNGDPYEANMNILATYVAREVSLRDLIANENSALALDQAARNYKGDVWVNALIKGKLSSPDIGFSIEFPPGSVMRNNISAIDILRRISEDDSENLRQVTYLIVFRSFAPYRQGGGQRNPGTDLAVNTISEVLSREMEKILTGVIQDITRDKSLSVDLSTNFYNSSQSLANVNAFSQYDRINVDFNLNKTFFNSRVIVNLGSDLDMNVRNTTATGFQFLPDVSVEFILTTNRRLRAIVFKRDNLDISGRRNRAGASISYRKDFERLFGKKDSGQTLIFSRQEEETNEHQKKVPDNN
jgi:hypothetical protein